MAEKNKKKLKIHKLKATPQRLAVLDALYKSKKHPDAESVFIEVRKRLSSISRGTVYSTLALLKERGLLHEVATPGDIKRYDADKLPHYHIACLMCNKIEDVEDIPDREINNLKIKVAKRTGYYLTGNWISFYGYCPKCRKKIKTGKGRDK